MVIDSPTKVGSLILFVVTTTFLSFILAHMKPPYLQKKDKSANLPKVIGMATLISFLFTAAITYISVKVDQQNLKIAKESSPL